MIKLKIVLNTFIICQLVLRQVEAQSRIVGGTVTNIRNSPYVVHLLDNNKFYCGGTIVSPKFVVTAAHCCKDKPINRITVVAGVTKLSEQGKRSQIAKMMIPKAYKKSTMNMDVAVLKLKTPLVGNPAEIKPIGLCNRGWKAGDPARIYGWGLLNENDKNAPNTLHTAIVRVIGRQKCANLYRNQISLSRTMFCAAIPGRKDACSGDSGGPMVINNQLCGVVSWGVGCARRNGPGVYTNVNAVKRFIVNAMKM